MALESLRDGGDVLAYPAKGVLIDFLVFLGLVEHGAGSLAQGYHVLADAGELAVILFHAAGHVFITERVLSGRIRGDLAHAFHLFLQFRKSLFHRFFNIAVRFGRISLPVFFFPGFSLRRLFGTGTSLPVLTVFRLGR